MKALIATSALAQLAGSELVALELLECLREHGVACDLTAHVHGSPMREVAQEAGAHILPHPGRVRLFDYDIAWLQTQVAPTLDLTIDEHSRPRTLCLFAHLDLKFVLAGPGMLEDLIADHFMYCSPEAAAHFTGLGLDAERAWVFHNAAPSRFAGEARAGEVLRHLTIISNHAPPELLDAAGLLREAGVEVVHYGAEGGIENIRMAPEHFARTDAVVTIGKSVQYSLLARRPVYVYDHLGGPGWLLEANFTACAQANFSGRCCGRKLGAAEIAAELLGGFRPARRAAQAWPETLLQTYRLEPYVRQILERSANAKPAAAVAALMAVHRHALERERQLAVAAYHYLQSREYLRGERLRLIRELELLKARDGTLPLPFPSNRTPGLTTSREEFAHGVVRLENGNGWSRLIEGDRYRLHAARPGAQPAELRWELRGVRRSLAVECLAGIAVPDCARLFLELRVLLGGEVFSAAATQLGDGIGSSFLKIHIPEPGEAEVAIILQAVAARPLTGKERAVVDLQPLQAVPLS
ncbi:hypothetical protein JYK14_08570 [Siccirubricoccus sp. KC 17139]|uniref:Glycosyltransferase family 1 protein n=1 Tax=Siccirubricoccus soli TaxID=2899147 RepID=A0ABT1D5D3_9PROT|nr:hypothetical protein [Siccirubricoccus soli]MCO6416220.1 hypothetical protein [Siccirubricoccus soli]MCP2682354.1 hypothetical protein [Siccirubricoccus soli]